MPRGRPTLYKPEYCDEIITLASEGRSITELAVCMGVNKSTLDLWADAHPEFAEAFEMAKQASQAWWEKQGREGVWEVQGVPGATKVNAALWSRNMAARFRVDWSESSKLELSGHLALTDMSEDEIRAELASLVSHTGAAKPQPADDDSDLA